MRVRIVTPEFVPVYGGVGNYVLQLATRLGSKCDVEIVTSKPTSDRTGTNPELQSVVNQLPSNVKVVTLETFKGGFLANFGFQVAYARYAGGQLSDHPDIIHTQSAMPDFFVSPRKAGAPVVTTVHTTVEGHIKSLGDAGVPLGALRRSEQFAVATAPFLIHLEDKYYSQRKHFITVSEWGKTEFSREKNILDKNIQVINIGVDSEQFSPENNAQGERLFPKLAEVRKPKVLYFSRMATRKGIHILLDAASSVLREVDAHFVFAGGGSPPAIGLSNDEFTFLGRLSPAEASCIYSMCDAFVLPSLYENFPACILESMSSGCAVVATRVGGIPEMITDSVNGILIPPNDANSLAASLVRLITDDKTRQSISRRGRQDSVQRFSWQTTAKLTLDYYDSILMRQI